MLQRTYKHKEFICDCNPNYAVGDEVMADGTVDWGNLPNHKDPRNERCLITVSLQDDNLCIYCGKTYRSNPLSGQIEVIKNGKYGSWQTNRPKKKEKLIQE